MLSIPRLDRDTLAPAGQSDGSFSALKGLDITMRAEPSGQPPASVLIRNVLRLVLDDATEQLPPLPIESAKLQLLDWEIIGL